MKISFKRATRILPVFFILMTVAMSLVSLVPAKHVFADNAVPTGPLVWDSNTHDNAVSANNIVFRSLGFGCFTGVGQFNKYFSGSGTSITLGPDAKQDGSDITVPESTEGGGTVGTVTLKGCSTNGGNVAPAFAWVTSFPTGTNYALIVNAHEAKVDAQHVPIYKPTTGGQITTASASVRKIINTGDIPKETLAITEIKVDPSKAGTTSSGSASNSNNTVPTDTCPIQTWQLRWIACPLFDAANTAINKLEAMITEYLSNDVQGIFGTTTSCTAQSATPSCAYYQAWNSFRVLAVSLIIIVGIIMVVSEATGFAIFDAYTIRKILPRLLISVILISISWWVMKFVIQFFNNISIWVSSLVSFPFAHVIDASKHTDRPWSVVGQWGIILVAIAALGPFGLLSYAGTIFLAMAVGWITLVIRRMIIVFAVMSAPLFIACFIMPNTQKMGKFWRDGFIGMLLMGPIFTLAVTMGQITAAIANGPSGSSGGGDPFGIISFVALVLPILSIPVLFSKIGGSVAGLVGFMNDKSKGGFDRLKNFRTEEMGRRKERAKSGELFGSGLMRGGAADKLNSFTSKAALGAKGNFGLGAKGKEAYDQRMAILSGQHAKSDAGQAGQFNDNMLRAQSYGSAAEARRNMKNDFGMGDEAINTAIAAARANGGWGKARQIYATKQLAATGTGYDNSQQMIETIARASGGNASIGAGLVGDTRGSSKRAGRSDLGGASYDNLNDMVQQQITANSGAQVAVRNAAGDITGYRPAATAPSAEQYRDLTVKAFQGTDMATLARDKGGSIKNITQALSGSLNAAHESAQAAIARGDNVAAEQHERTAAALTEQIKNFQSTAGIYAAPAHSKTIHQNIVYQDRGPVNPATGAYDHPAAPQIIQTVTRQSQPGSNMPHMQEEAEIYRSRRGGNDLNDPRLPGDE